MPSFRFYKMNPGGNTTVFILDPVAPSLRAPIARQLLQTSHLHAEQVGFLRLDTDPVRLDMMGGEFCGNACRAVGAVMVREKTGLERKNDMLCSRIAVSGVDELLNICVKQDTSFCRTQMPLLEAPDITRPAPGLSLVRLPGITHLCLDEKLYPFPKEYVQAVIDWRRQLRLNELAVGCIWYRSENLSIQPVVWVQETNSTCYESACGSGSLAVALTLTPEDKKKSDFQILQPSGARIGVELDTTARKAWIYGTVEYIAKGEVFVHLTPADD